MTVTLTLRSPPPTSVDGSGLAPERLAALSTAQTAALRLRCGRETVALGELFDVSGRGSEELRIAGDLQRIDGIGRGAARGVIVLDGHCGDRVGAQLAGAEIVVHGDTGAWTGAELQAGRITVHGSTGDRLGGVFAGGRVGMTGGEIIVTGATGQEAGAGLRRGLIGVAGRAGAGTGLRMLAGTVIALGGIGPEAGMGNKRGTIASGTAAELLPSYALATHFAPPALRLALRRLCAVGLPVPDAFMTGRWARWSGDRLELSRGEILIFDEEKSR